LRHDGSRGVGFDAFEIGRFIDAGKTRCAPGFRPGGARPQRLLWASTGTKDPTFQDVKYVEALVGPDTVDTIPMETLEAYKDHGDPRNRVEEDLVGAAGVLAQLPAWGLHMDTLVLQLENEGVEKFIQPFDKLLATLATFQDPSPSSHGSPVEASH